MKRGKPLNTSTNKTNTNAPSMKWTTSPLLEVPDVAGRFLSALSAYGAHYQHAMEANGDHGRGLFANKRFTTGEEICSIPAQLAVTGQLARKSTIGKAVNSVLHELQMQGKSCYCADTTSGDSPLAKNHCEDTSKNFLLPDQLALYAFLMYHRAKPMTKDDAKIHPTKITTDHEFWSIYAQWLPSSYTDPLCWPSELAATLLIGSSLLDVTLLRKKYLKEVYRLVICEAVKRAAKHLHTARIPPEAFSWSAFLWAHCAYTSRSFPASLIIDPSQRGEAAHSQAIREVGVMLPFMDLTNHLHNHPVCWLSYFPSPKEDSTCSPDFIAQRLKDNAADYSMPIIMKPDSLTAERKSNMQEDEKKDINLNGSPVGLRVSYVAACTIQAGQEVYNNYGPKSNEELLLGYGFVVPNNPYDRYSILIAGKSQRMIALLLLYKLGIPLTHYVDFGHLPSRLLKALRICTALGDPDLSLLSIAEAKHDALGLISKSDVWALHTALGSLRALALAKIRKLDETSVDLFVRLGFDPSSPFSHDSDEAVELVKRVESLHYLASPTHSDLSEWFGEQCKEFSRELYLAFSSLQRKDATAFDSVFPYENARFALYCALISRASQRSILLSLLNHVLEYDWQSLPHASASTHSIMPAPRTSTSASGNQIEKVQSDFASWMSEFASWIRERGGYDESFNSTFNICVDPKSGLLSYKANDNRVIFEIPQRAWITLEDARQDKSFSTLFTVLQSRNLDEALVLMCYLAFHISRGEDSELYPFLQFYNIFECSKGTLVPSYNEWSKFRYIQQIKSTEEHCTSMQPAHAEAVLAPLRPSCVKGLSSWSVTELDYFQLPSVNDPSEVCSLSESRALSHSKLESQDIRDLYEQCGLMNVPASDSSNDATPSNTSASVTLEAFKVASQIMSLRCVSLSKVKPNDMNTEDDSNKRVKLNGEMIQTPLSTLAIIPWPLEFASNKPLGTCRSTIAPKYSSKYGHDQTFHVYSAIRCDENDGDDPSKEKKELIPITWSVERSLESFTGLHQDGPDFEFGRGRADVLAEEYLKTGKGADEIDTLEILAVINAVAESDAQKQIMASEEIVRNSLPSNSLRLALEKCIPVFPYPPFVYQPGGDVSDFISQSLQTRSALSSSSVELGTKFIVRTISHHVGVDDSLWSQAIPSAQTMSLLKSVKAETLAMQVERSTGVKFAILSFPVAETFKSCFPEGYPNIEETYKWLLHALPLQLFLVLEALVELAEEEFDESSSTNGTKQGIIDTNSIAPSLEMIIKWIPCILQIFNSRAKQHQDKLSILCGESKAVDDLDTAELLALGWHREQVALLNVWSYVLSQVQKSLP